MALAKELMGAGFSAGMADAIGGQYNAITAAGSSQATATLLTAGMSIIGSADGTKGVVLPATQIGDDITVFNNAGSTCPVYPDSGSAIAVPGTGLGSANAAFSLLTYKCARFMKVTATQWLVIVSA